MVHLDVQVRRVGVAAHEDIQPAAGEQRALQCLVKAILNSSMFCKSSIQACRARMADDHGISCEA